MPGAHNSGPNATMERRTLTHDAAMRYDHFPIAPFGPLECAGFEFEGFGG